MLSMFDVPDVISSRRWWQTQGAPEVEVVLLVFPNIGVRSKPRVKIVRACWKKTWGSHEKNSGLSYFVLLKSWWWSGISPISGETDVRWQTNIGHEIPLNKQVIERTGHVIRTIQHTCWRHKCMFQHNTFFLFNNWREYRIKSIKETLVNNPCTSVEQDFPSALAGLFRSQLPTSCPSSRNPHCGPPLL